MKIKQLKKVKIYSKWPLLLLQIYWCLCISLCVKVCGACTFYYWIHCFVRNVHEDANACTRACGNTILFTVGGFTLFHCWCQSYLWLYNRTGSLAQRWHSSGAYTKIYLTNWICTVLFLPRTFEIAFSGCMDLKIKNRKSKNWPCLQFEVFCQQF